MSPPAMENLLHAIDLDSGVARKRVTMDPVSTGAGDKKKKDDNEKA